MLQVQFIDAAPPVRRDLFENDGAWSVASNVTFSPQWWPRNLSTLLHVFYQMNTPRELEIETGWDE